MHINGCHIVSKLDKDSEEGFSSTVERGGILKGPFSTILEAVTVAHAWKDDPPSESPVPSPIVPDVPPVPEQVSTVVHEAS